VKKRRATVDEGEEEAMVLSTLRLMIPPKKHGEVLSILKSMAEQNRIHRGCLRSRIYRDVEEERVFVFEEMWRSEEELKNHLRSNEYGKLLRVVGMALEKPEIRFNTITRWSGVETIEKARSSVRK
jgi:quinol monooxygenase YgiN